MPKRSSIDNEIKQQKQEEIQPEKPQKNPYAVELGRLGGLKGGKARAAKLTPEQRTDIARLAAQTRWRKSKGEGG